MRSYIWEHRKIIWKENVYNTALVLSSETPPSQPTSKLTAHGKLKVPPNNLGSEGTNVSILQTSYQGDPESKSSLGIPLSLPVPDWVEAKTPGTASNSSAPCHYLHILTVLWTLVSSSAQIVKFSGVATRVTRDRDCLTLTSSERKLQPPHCAHFGLLVLGLTKLSRNIYSGSFPPSPVSQAQLLHSENNSATPTRLWLVLLLDSWGLRWTSTEAQFPAREISVGKAFPYPSTEDCFAHPGRLPEAFWNHRRD